LNTGMTGSTGLPSREELVRLPVEALVDLLLAAWEQVAVRDRQIEQLTRRVEELERQARRTSRTSSKPPSSDPIHTKPAPGAAESKPGRDRSLRQRSGRNPGKQPGQPGATMRLVDDPDERVVCAPPVCTGCARDLGSAPVTGQQRHQVTEILPPPPPRIIEFLVQSKVCPGCGTASPGELPELVSGRAQYGVEVHARAAELVCAQHVPSPALPGCSPS
jgi:transposase